MFFRWESVIRGRSIRRRSDVPVRCEECFRAILFVSDSRSFATARLSTHSSDADARAG